MEGGKSFLPFLPFPYSNLKISIWIYIRQRIAEGATNEELQKLIADMDRIDYEFETDPDRLRREAKQYSDQKLREWCEKHGVEYNPTDDSVISDFINDAVKEVREV